MRTKHVFIIFILLSLLCSCSLNPSVDVPPADSPTSQAAKLIVGTWHYNSNGKDCEIVFNQNGTGSFEYYQYISPDNNLNNIFKYNIKQWSYNEQTNTLTIVPNSKDQSPQLYLVEELTESSLKLKRNGSEPIIIPKEMTK